jgi:murein DD-endopeptidase MepM/ murein hydrolase activator NlpD
MAVEDGVVESVYKEDVLLGTQIVVRHAEGLKSVYRFVNEVDGLQVGDKVEKGEVIATVAEANGNEYKDGAHLHFTIEKNSKTVEPTLYLTLEEK